MNPLDAWRFMAEAQLVMLRRSFALWGASPDDAGTALMRMAAEKQRAALEGVMAAGRAMLRGTRPEAVAAAALRPARRRVRRNLRGTGLS